MKLKKCIIYGNCQADALKIYLPRNEEFNSTYELVKLKAVHLLRLSDIPYLERVIRSVDLFIHQPISDNYKGVEEFGSNYLRSCLKDSALAISFPSLYFKGYNPELINVQISQLAEDSVHFTYYDKYILRELLDGQSNRSIYERIHEAPYQSKTPEIFNGFLNQLRIRETNLDIIVSDIIEKFGLREKLFHVFNHPNNRVLTLIAQRILSFITEQNVDYESDILGPDILARTKYPVHSKHMDMFSFANSLVYKVDNIEYDYNEYVNTCRSFLSKNRANIRDIDTIYL